MKRFGPALLLVLLMGVALAQVFVPPSVATQVGWWVMEVGPGFRARLEAIMKLATAVAGGVGIAHLQRMLERESGALASVAEAHTELESVYTSGATPRDIVRTEVFIGYVPEEIDLGNFHARGADAEDVVRQWLIQYWYDPYGTVHFASVEEALRGFYATIAPCPDAVADAGGGLFSLGWSSAKADSYSTCPSVDDPAVPMWESAIANVTYGGVVPVSDFHVAAVPDIVLRRNDDEVFGTYGAIERLYFLGYNARASLGIEYCKGSYGMQVWAMVGARYVFDRWEGNKPIGRLAAVVNRGAVFRLGGSVPDQGFRSFVLYAGMSPTYEFALWEVISAGNLIRDAWARACMGVAGGEVRPYPWDVEGAGDFGTAVRQRDAAEVWWIARPLEALRVAFVPRISLAQRFQDLSAFLADRFPFSVWLALRNYVPPVGETAFSLPCFSIGAYSLCPNEAVVSMLGQASRLGMVLLLGLGVMMWLRSRVSVSLRL